MSQTMECICGLKDLSKLIANVISNLYTVAMVTGCHGNRSRKDQTAKMVVFIMFWTIFLEREVFSSNL